MRKVTTFLVVLCMAVVSVTVAAQEQADLALNPALAQTTDAGQTEIVNHLFVPAEPLSGKVHTASDLKKGVNVATAAAKVASKAPRKAAPTSTAALAGSYVCTYKSLVSDVSDGGTPSVLSAVGTDSIKITNFFTPGIDVTAAVNFETGAVTIPSQVCGAHSDYGDVDIAVLKADGTPDRANPVAGTLNADGTITFTSQWGLFVVSGTYADQYVMAGYETEFEKTNAIMHVERYDTTLTYDWAVVMKQVGKNIVNIKNFANHGHTVEVILNGDSTIYIPKQKAYASDDELYGDFYTVACDWDNNKIGTVTTIYGTTDGKSISFGNWTLYSSSRYYTGKFKNATISGDGVTIEVPVHDSADFAGAGTESDPYQIKTADDLVKLSAKVAGDANTTYGTSIKHTKSFVGKYFKVINDIDMNGYRLIPIGADANHRFAATFDGNNKTISNLYVNTADYGYAALFGNVDTVGVVKNVILKDASVTSEGYYTAGIAAFATATSVINCHVTGVISSTGICVGGVVGLGYNVEGSSFEGTVTGSNGVVGGLAGQVYGVIKNSYAKGTVTVDCENPTYTGGGVAATLYGPASGIENSYFAGTVDGSGSSNLIVGGVAGNVYQGYIKNSYAVGNVYGYYNQAVVGGVVGNLQGTLTNTYFRGYVSAAASRYTAGIAGYVRDYVKNNAYAGSVIRSSYTANRQSAETYQYDTATETRETVGTVAEGASFTCTNVYYDKQLNDYNSEDGRGKTTTELTSASGPTGFSASDWVFSEGAYPRLKDMAETDAAKLGASAFVLDAAFPNTKDYVANNAKVTALGNTTAAAYKNSVLTADGNNVTVSNTAVTLKGTFGTDTLALLNAQDANLPRLYTIVDVAPKYFEGNGTEADPFLIKTKADLMKLGEITTNVRQNYPKVYFKQTNDIDMELDTAFTGMSNAIDDNTYVRFEGTYDGDGHTLHRLYLDYVNWSVRPTETEKGTVEIGGRSSIYKGLFGQLGTTGVVKNLRIAADSHIYLFAYAAPFVGFNYGKVENCRNYADIYGISSYIGGIVGTNNVGASVSNCFNAGNVYVGYSVAGGIVGSNYSIVENSQNVGNVQAKNISSFSDKNRQMNAGGIVGTNLGGSVYNCVNAGHVSAGTQQAGGVVAGITTGTGSVASAFKNVINYGTVFSPSITTTGGFSYSGTSATFTATNTCYDAQLTGLGAVSSNSIESVTAAKTADLTSGSYPGLDVDVWSQAAGRYPILKEFEDEPLALAAAQVVFTAAGEETSKQLVNNATLSSVEGTTWALAKGTDFAVDGTALKVPSTNGLIVDTLTAKLNGFERPIAIRAIAPNPLAGSGTESDPFLIRYASEWNALAAYMASTQSSFEGKYVKVVNDLDFADTAFVSLANDNVTAFAGNLLGNGKTLKNVKFTPTSAALGAIGNVSGTGVVSDLTMQGSVSSTVGNSGAFVGKLYGKLVNCVNEIDITSTAAVVGGFAGYAYDGAQFEGCVNKATVTGSKGQIAGFAGRTTGLVTFTDCVNEGKIVNEATSTSYRYMGGFVGNGVTPTYIRCVNKGEIVGGAASYVGGIQGYVTGGDTIKFIECHNEAPVTGNSATAGLLGYGATGATKSHIYVSKSYNTGDITTTAKVTNGCAGLIGYLTPGSVIEDSYNTGTITGATHLYTGGLWGYGASATADTRNYIRRSYNTGNVISGTSFVAGLGAFIPAYTTIDSCYNTGSVQGTLSIAGIGNVSGAMVLIYRSWNSGDITATTHSAGGIVGAGTYESYSSDVFNTGNVTAPYNAGGLSARARMVFVNSYNRGTISGGYQVGGLVGLPSVGTTSAPATMLYGCYNAGKVVNTGTGATTGNLIGNTGASYWDTSKGNVINNTYYVTDFGTFAQDTIGGNAVTIKQLASLTSGIESPVRVIENPQGWNYGDEYSFPVINGYGNNDCAKAFAAAVVLADGDSLSNVTKNFNIGLPENVSWTTSNSVVSFTGTNAYITEASTAKVVLTSQCGEYSAPWDLTLNTTTGVDGVNTNKQIVGETYYNVAGQRVAKPETKDGQVYIVTVTYDDGTTENVKRYNK